MPYHVIRIFFNVQDLTQGLAYKYSRYYSYMIVIIIVMAFHLALLYS